MNNGTSYFAEPVVLAPMTSDYPLIAEYSYLFVTLPALPATWQIVSSHLKLQLIYLV
jgi:hypothetical protein